MTTLRFLLKNIFLCLKPWFKGKMIDKILLSGPFHMKFMKLVKAYVVNFIINDHCNIIPSDFQIV